MEYKKILGKVKVPVLGLGTWAMGGGFSKDTSHDEEEIRAIQYALDLGMRHIDTAELYGNGHAEELVGKAIKGWRREEIFITTKVWSDHLRFNQLIEAAKRSLGRLGTDYIDLYLIHWPNPQVPLQESMEAMDYLIDKKLIRFIGVSNFDLHILKKAQKYTEHPIAANQVEYHLLNRKIERDLLPCCQHNGILLTAYKPLARGRLVGGEFPILNRLAKKYGKTPAQIALNWLISKKSVIAIPKSSSKKHLEENIGAVGWSMEEKDVKILEEAFP
ncbi:MAG TPA: aldo/keto reductase [Candidatus Omnitrophica bacterium]|nr:aldo/keto reductase [Candidatus Omnitrophota bacterium]